MADFELADLDALTIARSTDELLVLDNTATPTSKRITISNLFRVFNVMNYGAVGDGATDDTTAIQNAIAAWQASGGTLYFPYGTNGRYVISSTLTLGANGPTGGTVLAAGVPTSTYYYSPGYVTVVDNLGVALVWKGAAGGIMVNYDGLGLTWDGPALWAKYDDITQDTAATGFEITKASSLGSGKVHFRQLTVCGATGRALHLNGTTNVDTIQCDRFFIKGCANGLHVEAIQNVSNLFGYVDAHTVTGAVFQFDNLTHTKVMHVNANSNITTLVRIDAAASASGGFFLDSMKVDTNSANMIYVDAGDTANVNLSHCRVVLANVTGAGGTDTDRVRLKGEVNLKFRDCNNLGTSVAMLKLSGASTLLCCVHFDGCRMGAATPSSVTNSTNGFSYVKFTNCDVSCEPYADQTELNDVPWQPVAVAPAMLPSFADATARDAEWTSPVAGWQCWLVSPGVISNYNGASWEAVQIS